MAGGKDAREGVESARERIEAGVRLRLEGRAAEAREQLRVALDLAHRAGAAELERRAREELVAAGGRPRRPALTGTAALTPGERRVAEMAASGMKNREIADALVVTPKAVGWHLRNVYRKLAISNRLEIAAALESDDEAAA